MAESHVLTGLIAKRAELAGQIEHAQDKLRQLVIDLDHIDAAIHTFDPSIELVEGAASFSEASSVQRRGDEDRLGHLTQRKRPLTTAEIAQRVMAERGLDTANVRLLKTMQKRTGACLRHWEHGLQKPGLGRFMLWELVC